LNIYTPYILIYPAFLTKKFSCGQGISSIKNTNRLSQPAGEW